MADRMPGMAPDAGEQGTVTVPELAGPTIVDQVRALRALLAARIRADLQYRTSFALMTFAAAAFTALDFAVIAVLFVQVPALGNWTVWEVGLLYGISGIGFALADLLVGSVESAPGLVRTGDFDQFLIRPVEPLVQLLADRFALRRVGQLAQAVAVLAVAVPRVDVSWTAAHVVLLVVAVVGAAVIFGALFVGGTAVVLHLVDAREAVNAFTYGGEFLAEYPLPIFGRWLRNLVVFVVPLAFVAYLPARLLLGKDELAGLPTGLAWLSPVVAAVMVACAAALWRRAVRRYRSTGS